MRTHPSHARPSGWNALLPTRMPTEPAAGEHHCAFAVVGAGFTGLAAARTFAEARPDAPVFVLDADTVGEGSSGRNSGFLLDIALADDADPNARERMARMNALTRGAMATIAELVRIAGIDCDLVRAGTYRAAATRRGADAIERYRRFLEASELPFETLDAAALRTRLGTAHYRVGLHSPDCHLVQPAALVRGLADALPPTVTLHERSAVVRVERRADGWTLHTQDARIHAERVLMANNAWAGTLGFAADRLTPVYTYAALTPPLDPDELGADAQWGLLPAARLGTTLRRTAEDRLLVRSGYSYRAEDDLAEVEAQLRESMARRWPQLSGVAFDHVWGGSTGITLNGASVFETAPSGMMISAGCNGGGVVKGTLFGTLMARRAIGEDIPDVAALFGRADRVPPDPIRRLGFSLLTARWRIEAGAER